MTVHISIIRWRRRQAAKRIDFDLDWPVDVMVDGEVITMHCQTLDVLHSALNVVA